MTLPISVNKAAERAAGSAIDANAAGSCKVAGVGMTVAGMTVRASSTVGSAAAATSRVESIAAHHAFSGWAKGNRVTTLPVSLRQALATAGAIGGRPGSPMPVGFSVDLMIATSTSGISPMRKLR